MTNKLGDFLREQRKQAGYSSIQAFAEKMRINKNTQGSYERGDVLPDIDYLVDFHNLTGTDLPEMLSLRLQFSEGYAGSLEFRETPKPLENDTSAPGAADLNTDYALIPLYDVAASLGHGSHIEQEEVVDRLAFKKTWIKQVLGASPEDLALIGARGDSMEPTITDGDTVLIDLRFKDISGPGIYVLQLMGGLVAKRCEEYPGGFVSIKSDNNRYPGTGIEPEHRSDLVVIGRVVWVGHKL